LVFYNKAMFDAAGLAYPTDNWTFEDMRQAAIQLTLDANGRNPTDLDFAPDTSCSGAGTAVWTIYGGDTPCNRWVPTDASMPTARFWT
jgi:ABC-type glycerol-3-phosphate transport system substrate-binding protein